MMFLGLKSERRARTAVSRWMRLAVGLAVVTQVGLANAEVVVRKPSETDDNFMARVLGASAELAQKVVRSTEIANGRLALIGFVNREDNTLVGHLLVEMSPGRYEHVEFPSCDEEGGAPPQRPSLPLAESPGIGYAANEEESATRDVLDGEKEGPIDVHLERR